MARCPSCQAGEKCDTCRRVRVCEEHGYPFGVAYDSYTGGYEADGIECQRCHRAREAREKIGDEATRILRALEDGGYSWVLEWDGKRHAYLQDEDSDNGPERVAVAAVRMLVETENVAAWRQVGWHGRHYVTYRPTLWVEHWLKEHPKPA